eukprot:761425-Hanusia_phi.AAC.2
MMVCDQPAACTRMIPWCGIQESGLQTRQTAGLDDAVSESDRQRNKHRGSLEVSFVHDQFRSFFLAEATLEQLGRQVDGATTVPESLTVCNLRGELESIKEQDAMWCEARPSTGRSCSTS